MKIKAIRIIMNYYFNKNILIKISRLKWIINVDENEGI